ncbi:MAG: leucine-rich repeat protein [Prevotella sp.]|nr:leucine-rich repeat protein [Prevotella sp.]
MKKIIFLSAILSVTALTASADEYTDPQTKVVYTYEPGKPTASVKAGYEQTIDIDNGHVTMGYTASPDAAGDVVILDRFTVGAEEYVVTSIGFGAFLHNKNIKSVSIPETVTDIEPSAFYGCESLTKVHLPQNLTRIADFLFNNCGQLVSVAIPPTVSSIGNDAFALCSNLASITLPESLTYIGSRAFYGTPWYDKQYAEAPDGIFYIGPLLAGYKGDKPTGDLVIREGTTTIEREALRGCNGLTSITIPQSVMYIGTWAFGGCRGLEAVHITDLSAWCKIIFGWEANPLAFAHHLFLNGEEVTNLVIPEDVSIVGSGPFQGFSGLTSVTFPEGVTSIRDLAFKDCSRLTCVSFPSSLKSIGSYAFENCTSLTNITIPEGVDSIGYDAFEGCNGMTTVTLPSTISHISEAAFWNCDALTSVISWIEKPFEISAGVFGLYVNGLSQSFTSATLYVPMGCKARYENTAGWKRFTNIVEMGGTLGDANSDGNLTVADMTAIAHHVLGITPEGFSETAADANQDGQVNVADYTAVAHLLLYGSITSPEKSRSIGADASQRRTPPTDNMEFDNTANSPFRRWEASAPTDAGLDNMVYIAPMKAVAGEELTLSVRMRNSVDAEGFQFNLILPSGVTLGTDGEGKAEARLAEERTTATRTNTFATSIQPDGSLTVMAASTNASTISTGDGEVCTVKVRIADNIAEGDYPLLLKCIAISDTDARSLDVDIVQSTLTIGDASSITSVAAQVTKSEYVDLQGRRITGNPNPGIYIENGRKRVVSR